ncbi:LPS translocon maturation chaperone LptM [Hydrogenophaga laconesensis]|uniref:Small lipoprotein YifL n=1 Tax=Hydrogenophaga laconesensis TaxID=1805971 RepID=A0ABU1VAJ0_9BURK|nr:lipoprotein [Hydrogenophaga laconesensis]MDR7094425.1 putative small lipoprotein YifL [Hydrogenophaga laconesensis]
MAFIASLFGVLMLAACGQKGPLYLPGPDTPEAQKKPGSVQTTPSTPPSPPAPR